MPLPGGLAQSAACSGLGAPNVGCVYMKKEAGEVRNVFREDKDPHLPGEFTEDLLAEAPRRQDNFVKVKKIL